MFHSTAILVLAIAHVTTCFLVDGQDNAASCDGVTFVAGVGYKAHPSDCSKFIMCVSLPDDSIQEITQSCPVGTFWDSVKVTCNYGHSVHDCHHQPQGKLLLTYFDLRGRGEITRLLFAASKQPYDQRLVSFAEWPAMKPTTPFGSLPLLTLPNGHVYAQSLAIQQYVASEFGMYGATDLEKLVIDQLSHAREDLFILEDKIPYEPNPVIVAQLQATVNARYPMYLGAFEKALNNNPMKTGFVLGDKLTLADLIIFEGTQTLVQTQPTFLNNYPAITAMRTKVAALDGIAQYLAARKYSSI